MKNKLLITGLLLLSTFTFFSCEEENMDNLNFNEKELNNYYGLYEDIIAVEDLNEQLNIVNSLSSVEKYNLWQLKLNDFLSNNSLTVEQSLFINKLMSEINLELFEDESKRAYFLENKREKFMRESQKLFGHELGRYLLTKFENSNQTIQKLERKSSSDLIAKNIAPISSCDCAKDGDCSRITGLSIVGISWEYGICSDEKCYKETIHILGWTIWESSDNGRCKY